VPWTLPGVPPAGPVRAAGRGVGGGEAASDSAHRNRRHPRAVGGGGPRTPFDHFKGRVRPHVDGNAIALVVAVEPIDGAAVIEAEADELPKAV
jgi:hypothetical protein